MESTGKYTAVGNGGENEIVRGFGGGEKRLAGKRKKWRLMLGGPNRGDLGKPEIFRNELNNKPSVS